MRYFYQQLEVCENNIEFFWSIEQSIRAVFSHPVDDIISCPVLMKIFRFKRHFADNYSLINGQKHNVK